MRQSLALPLPGLTTIVDEPLLELLYFSSCRGVSLFN
jgi:hypothetical protein